ncbi:MAG: ImmA/IrrE family metallo-endopeptidase [Labilithrix sp.]|nr:ImmA/IrrE family metallo-endopeptidase [Labilithrix sp.]MCW5835871.1 ImmA/IrrE family metallo-endopeptidase [Labilithrix sp.]
MARKDLRRGFKAEAERIALELRAELKLGAGGRLDPRALAEHLCVPIRTLRDLADVAGDDVGHFLGHGRSAFSAATIYVGRFNRLIITNPAHARTRQMNSLCHELSHIVLDHESETPRNAGGGRSWNGVQEREADWLAGCLLIPNAAAHAAARAGRTDAEVAATFGVSRALATWRMRMTGARIRARRFVGLGR